MEKNKLKIAAVKKAANAPKRKTRPFKAEILDADSELLPSLELAKLHESNQRFLAAAELYEALYSLTKKEVFLQNIDRIAKTAIDNGRPFVAQAIFVKMSIISPRTRDQNNYLERAASLDHENNMEDVSLLEFAESSF